VAKSFGKDRPGGERLANIVGALALALADQLAVATEVAAGHIAAAPAALVALHDLLAGRSIDDLRRAVGLTHSGTVRLVDRLVADGLAQRRPSADGRAVAVALTPQGRRLARRTMAARRAALADVLDVLNPRECAQLTAITEKLVGVVAAHRLRAHAAGHEPPGGWLCRLCDPDACERPDGRCPAASAAAQWTNNE
jgi:MarR family transcriptional regulator, negative regulator of the multidrug operon emrRAB